MRGCRIANLIDTFHDRIQSGIVTDRYVCTIQVIVDRTRQTHNRHVELFGKDTGTSQ